ncbi:MAG: hypothetical protein PHP44_01545 [Kiritimatiellae bacterium]|nr:hypothetical protein [Kiritimatiellia bacterium]
MNIATKKFSDKIPPIETNKAHLTGYSWRAAGLCRLRRVLAIHRADQALGAPGQENLRNPPSLKLRRDTSVDNKKLTPSLRRRERTCFLFGIFCIDLPLRLHSVRVLFLMGGVLGAEKCLDG